MSASVRRLGLWAVAMGVFGSTLSLYVLLLEWKLFLTVLGTACSLAGTACAGWALWQNHTPYGSGHLLPALAKIRSSMRRVLQRKRKGKQVALSGTISLPGLSMTAELTVDRDAIAANGPVRDQILAAVDRMRKLEERLTAQHSKDVAAIRNEIQDLRAATETADSRLDTMARDIGVGTVKLQLWGLVLVGLGAVLLAIPAFASA